MISRREVCHSYLVVGKGKNMSFFSKRAWRNISTNAFPERTHRVVSFPDPLAGRFFYTSYLLRPALCAQRIDITNHLFLCNTKEVCDFSIHIESSIFDTLPYMNCRKHMFCDRMKTALIIPGTFSCFCSQEDLAKRSVYKFYKRKEIWLILKCSRKLSLVEGRFSKWF